MAPTGCRGPSDPVLVDVSVVHDDNGDENLENAPATGRKTTKAAPKGGLQPSG